jgi:predicted ATP-grasp superfamily ATP-dependent carboligase
VRRVLVLDASSRNTLSACRALGRAGFQVAAAGYRPRELAGSSRYCKRYHVLPDPSGPAEPFADALSGIVSRHGYEVVVSTDDATIARLGSTPPPVTTVPHAGDGFTRLVDKVGLAALCDDAGVAYPRTIRLGSEGSIRAALDELGAPVVVKAGCSARATPQAVFQHWGATVTADLSAAAEAAAEIRAAGIEPVAQTWVRRRVKVDVVLFRRRGRSEVRLAYEVQRDVPLTGGLGVTLETISADHGVGAAAVDALERVCDAAGYEGLANGEFSVSADDGRLHLIEVNPRLWASSWFGERLGQRIAERCIAHALELPPPAAGPYPVGRRYHDAVGELRWLSLHRRRRRRLVELLKSIRPRDVFEYDDVTDPGPLVGQLVTKLRRRLHA